jgi:hypothetical protein
MRTIRTPEEFVVLTALTARGGDGAELGEAAKYRTTALASYGGNTSSK